MLLYLTELDIKSPTLPSFLYNDYILDGKFIYIRYEIYSNDLFIFYKQSAKKQNTHVINK